MVLTCTRPLVKCGGAQGMRDALRVNCCSCSKSAAAAGDGAFRRRQQICSAPPRCRACRLEIYTSEIDASDKEKRECVPFETASRGRQSRPTPR